MCWLKNLPQDHIKKHLPMGCPIEYYEGTGSLLDFTELYLYVAEECISGTSPNYHHCLGIYLVQ